MFEVNSRLDDKPDTVHQYQGLIRFVKYVGKSTIIACDNNFNLLIFNAITLEQIRCLPYGHDLKDAVGHQDYVFCAFEMKLVCFQRTDWNILNKWDTVAMPQALALNEFNQIRVCGLNKMNWYLYIDEDFKFAKHQNDAPFDVFTNIHSRKHGFENFMVAGHNRLIITDISELFWL